MSYYTQTTKSSSSRSGGGQSQSTVTETRTYIDADGTKRTETVTYGGDGGNAPSKPGVGSRVGNWVQGKLDNIGHKFEDGFHIGKINPRKSKPTEARYTRGWSSRRRPEVSSALPVHPGGKSFDEIRSQCIRENRLFEDPDFRATDSSIFYSRSPPRPFDWKRPTELCDDPQLFVGGATRFDIIQGELGDCWLLAAVASLTVEEKLLHKVVPQDQGFGDGYAGCFHFRFWRFGQWEDVIIDDRLPTYYNKLVFLHSDSKNEFWSALLEKAYAKLHGSYEALKGGATSEAMEDFTGGVTEMYDFRTNLPKNLFQIMLQAHQRSSLMGCSIEGQGEGDAPNGLISGHAYSITDVRMVDIRTSRTQGKIPMLRVRNPWGNEREWTGAWSDKSPEWKFISESDRRQMGLSFAHDGEFWMSYQDFSTNFQKLEICHLGVEGMDDDSRGFWSCKSLDGSWRRRVSAGGCRNFLDTFWTNPQYRVSVTDADDEDDENMGTLIIGLMQKNRRKLREQGKDMLTMGYAIYKLKEESHGPLDLNFFKYNASAAKSPSFINLREVCGRHRLSPGEYCIIPSTFEPNEEGDFLLRIFSEKPNASEEMDEDTGMSDVQPRGGGTGGGASNGVIGTTRPSRPRPLPPQPPRVVEVEDKDGGRPVAEVTDEERRIEKGMYETFKKVAGHDLEIDAYELKSILEAAFRREMSLGDEGFSSETCRSMVAMMDDDKSGKLGFEEFKKLWVDLRLWKSVFKKYDKDQSGSLNSYELRNAIHSSGYSVSNGTFNGLVQRYSRRNGQIFFDDFLHCVVRMKTMFETFKEMKQPNGKAEFTMDQFIQTTMYS